ncbi:MarR family winged helix-turn-helix transcriptional regulator [Paenibacillus sp. GCM10012307]|uniref:MarR family winged helix-turn-helix transcriptional regulator n=1 Tax=Paenibacillus TaxID=44249 RepID=UPI002FCDFB8A
MEEQLEYKKRLFQKMIGFTSAVHQTSATLTKGVKSDEITPVQYSILEHIMLHQPVTISEISECQHMSMPNTSRELRKLSEKGLCEKVETSADRRKQYIRLSPEGKRVMDVSFQLVEERFLQLIQSMEARELEELAQAIDLLQAKVFR